VEAKLGVGPDKAVDFQALTGDSTDNVPGVPGIGPKGAAKLLSNYDSLDEILNSAPEMKKSKQRQNLIDFKDQALISRELVRLSQDAPVGFDPEAFKVTEPDPAVLSPVLAELEFTSLLKQFSKQPEEIKTDYRTMTDPKELEAYLARCLEECGRISLDTETTAINPMLAELVGISLSYEDNQGIYIPVGHNLAEGETQADKDAILKVLEPYLANGKLEIIGQNIKYDLIVLEKAGLKLDSVQFDTMVASYLVNPGKPSHSLEALAAELLGRSMISYEEAAGGKNKNFADVDLDMATRYAAEDADVTWQAAGKLGPQLKKAGVEKLFTDLEMPLVSVLAKMEMTGVGLDVFGLTGLSREITGDLDRIEQTCYRLAGHKFNLNSPKQLGAVLFEELGLRHVKKTKKKSGYSTDMSVLTILAAEHELPAEVLNYRTLNKLKSTYLDILPELVNPKTGRIHSSFNQAVTATGRLSSSDPNLQNIPVRSEFGERIRACFVPQNGRVMLSADYSQIELRVLAHLSGDPLLVDDLTGGLDVHTLTASRLFEVEPDEVTKDMRSRAKTVNFGVLYGMSAFRLAREQGISQAEAQEIIQKYLGRYKGIADFQQSNLISARDKGYVTTLLGRRRFLPAINSSERMARESAERMALNTPIQGTAADLIKLAMLKADELLRAEFPETLMILQVHDELLFEVPPEQVEPFSLRIKQVMEGVIKLKVPLTVDMGWGKSWAEAH
jgi:DNA polymerase-1